MRLALSSMGFSAPLAFRSRSTAPHSRVSEGKRWRKQNVLLVINASEINFTLGLERRGNATLGSILGEESLIFYKERNNYLLSIELMGSKLQNLINTISVTIGHKAKAPDIRRPSRL